ncbi:MAG: hypothetical protein KC646_11240 [Candidatus Cloacimonetes bacterium]|nr:hypothetical protein [Candidatus Cloacimonadota bacterium]
MPQEIQSNNDIKIGSSIALIAILVIVLFAIFFKYQSKQTVLDEPIVRKTKEAPQIINVLEIPQNIEVREQKPEKLLQWTDLKATYNLGFSKPTGFLSALLKKLSLEKSQSDIHIALLEFDSSESAEKLFFQKISLSLHWTKDFHSYSLDGLSYRLLDKYMILSESSDSKALKLYLNSIYNKLSLRPYTFKSGRLLNYVNNTDLTNSHFSKLKAYVFEMGGNKVYVASREAFDQSLGNFNSLRKFSIGDLTLQRVFNVKSPLVVYVKRSNTHVVFTNPLKKHLAIQDKAKLIRLFN